MKTWLPCLLAVMFFTGNLEAQSISARVEAKTARTGKTLQRLWETDYGSFDRDHLRVTFLDLRLSTVGRAPFDAVLEVVFFGRHPATKQMLAASWQSGPVTIEPGKIKRYLVSSGAVKSNTTKYAALGEFYGSGTSISAWHVRLTKDGKLLGEAHSGTPLDFAKLPAMAAAAADKGILDKAEAEALVMREVGLQEVF